LAIHQATTPCSGCRWSWATGVSCRRGIPTSPSDRRLPDRGRSRAEMRRRPRAAGLMPPPRGQPMAPAGVKRPSRAPSLTSGRSSASFKYITVVSGVGRLSIWRETRRSLRT
jgi:hypothetical protein